MRLDRESFARELEATRYVGDDWETCPQRIACNAAAPGAFARARVGAGPLTIHKVAAEILDVHPLDVIAYTWEYGVAVQTAYYPPGNLRTPAVQAELKRLALQLWDRIFPE